MGGILFNSLNMQASLAPAVELEGYYMDNGTFTAHDINHDTTRLDEHDFLVIYPMSTGVFLGNAVLNFQTQTLYKQPLEAGVNHYNANTNDTVAAFAGQTKIGFNFDVMEHLSVFAEYRWLYNANFVFGSTIVKYF